MALSGVAALVCLVAVLTLVFTSYPRYPNLLPLLVIGIPVLIAGQLWVILVLNARMRPDGTARRTTFFNPRRLSGRDMFGGAPSWVGATAIALFLVGVLSFLVGTHVSHRAQAASDPAGVLLAFFAAHWGVETAEHYRRKRSGGGSATPGPEHPNSSTFG